MKRGIARLLASLGTDHPDSIVETIKDPRHDTHTKISAAGALPILYLQDFITRDDLIELSISSLGNM